jgi:hypothetical protein
MSSTSKVRCLSDAADAALYSARPVAPRSTTSAVGHSAAPDREIHLTSNVAQSYPYTTETEPERVAAIERATSQFEGLAAKIGDESTPIDDLEPEEPGRPNRSWVFICPVHVTGRLHVAGYARERHALYVVCDEAGETYLR